MTFCTTPMVDASPAQTASKAVRLKRLRDHLDALRECVLITDQAHENAMHLAKKFGPESLTVDVRYERDSRPIVSITHTIR